MNYLITAEQKNFFEKQHFIEFEGFLTEEQLAILKKCKECTRDLSRKNFELSKIVKNKLFAKLAKELFLQKELRLGYDEIIEFPLSFSEATSLEEISSVRPLVGALMLCIEGESDNSENEPLDGFAPFPQKPGNAIFFAPSHKWNLEAIAKRKKQKFLLIAYAAPRAMYIFQDKDRYTHTLKALGLVFGDRLREKDHPILGR